LLEGLFGQLEARTVARAGLALQLPTKPGQPLPREAALPKLPEFNARDTKRADYGGADLRAGFSVEMRFKLADLAPGQVLLDSRDGQGRGLLLATAAGGALRIVLHDGRSESAWESDAGSIRAGGAHHVIVTVDGGPKIITFVVDGVLNDGGHERQFGWGRFSPHLRTPNGAAKAKLAPALSALRIYTRALRTSEAVGNYRAGP
jgi:hypothetical protein